MKRILIFCITGLLLFQLIACENVITVGQSKNEENTNGGNGEVQNANDTDIENTIGKGVTFQTITDSDEAELTITGCPPYGDKRTPYVYGKLTKGDSFAYELITIIIVNGNYYGKKPFESSPNGFIDADNKFRVQYSSNDGQGTDWNAEKIFLFLIPTGYKDEIKADSRAGYIVPPSQIAVLKENSVAVVQIDRKIPE